MCGHFHTVLRVEDFASEAEMDPHARHLDCDWSLRPQADRVGADELFMLAAGKGVISALLNVNEWLQVISTYQACILMLFNQQESYSTVDICRDTKLPMEELKKYLQTLALSKYQILTKSPNPKSKDISDSDVFTFNRFAFRIFRHLTLSTKYDTGFFRKFTDRQRKIKMSLLVTKVSWWSCAFGSSIC